eukprot:TRINITY_DN81_c0_g1_i8.p1 TRINITY_DN81_c0_g1~~TRINITY_DN81_c0_g1_i8.p1  ORF type:complete len:698 (+),score=142.26 TRINITY_DN81_c0_g1_i8:1453-3546(+)
MLNTFCEDHILNLIRTKNKSMMMIIKKIIPGILSTFAKNECASINDSFYEFTFTGADIEIQRRQKQFDVLDFALGNITKKQAQDLMHTNPSAARRLYESSARCYHKVISVAPLNDSALEYEIMSSIHAFELDKNWIGSIKKFLSSSIIGAMEASIRSQFLKLIKNRKSWRCGFKEIDYMNRFFDTKGLDTYKNIKNENPDVQFDLGEGKTFDIDALEERDYKFMAFIVECKKEILEISKSELSSNGLKIVPNMILNNNSIQQVKLEESANISKAVFNGEKVDFTGKKFNDNCCVVISAFLKNSQTVKELTLKDNCIGDDGANLLAAVLKENTILRLFDIRSNTLISKIGAEKLAHEIVDNGTIEEFGGIAVKRIKNSEATLVSLKLKNSGCGDSEALVIGKLLKVNTALTEIDFSNHHDETRKPRNNISVEAIREFVKGLDGNKFLKELTINGLIPIDKLRGSAGDDDRKIDLHDKNYHGTDAIVIKNLLKNNTVVTDLDFRKNPRIVGEEAKEFSEFINGKIQENEDGTGIIKFSGMSVAELKRNSRNLKKLASGSDPNLKDFGDTEAYLLGDLLKVNNTITDIDIADNEITEAGAVALASGLKCFGVDLKEDKEDKNQQSNANDQKKGVKKLTLNGLIDLESLGKETFNFQSDKYKVTDVIVIAHLLADNSKVKKLDCNGSKDKKKNLKATKEQN